MKCFQATVSWDPNEVVIHEFVLEYPTCMENCIKMGYHSQSYPVKPWKVMQDYSEGLLQMQKGSNYIILYTIKLLESKF